MSHYSKAKDFFGSCIQILNKQPKKEEWAIQLCKGLSELSEGMKRTDDLLRGVGQMTDTIQQTIIARTSSK